LRFQQLSRIDVDAAEVLVAEDTVVKYTQYNSAGDMKVWTTSLRELSSLNSPMTVSHEKFGIPTGTTVLFRFDNLSATTEASSNHFYEYVWVSSEGGTRKVPGFDNCEQVLNKRMAAEIRIYILFNCIDLSSL
jgi:hypothetical protein